MFFAGLLLCLVTVGALVASAAIFDAGRRLGIVTYFFQPNNLSDMRLPYPVAASEIDPAVFRRMMVEKYISEYFYIVPDVKNVEARMQSTSVLANMSSRNVFKEWLTGEGKYIQDQAAHGWFRTVALVGDMYMPDDGDFWLVTCDMATWHTPNDMSTGPEVRRLVLKMGIIASDNITAFRPSLDGRELTMDDVNRYLKQGGDPAALFRFMVTYIGIKEEKAE